jgi:hypothetical protein
MYRLRTNKVGGWAIHEIQPIPREAGGPYIKPTLPKCPT